MATIVIKISPSFSETSPRTTTQKLKELVHDQKYEYRQPSLQGYLYKTESKLKRTPRVGPAFLYPF